MWRVVSHYVSLSVYLSSEWKRFWGQKFYNSTKFVLYSLKYSIVNSIKLQETATVVYVILVIASVMTKLDGVNIIAQQKVQNHRNTFKTVSITILHGLSFQMINKCWDQKLIMNYNWDKVFKNGPNEICGGQPLKNLKWYQFKFFKDCLPQISLCPVLNTLSQLFYRNSIQDRSFWSCPRMLLLFLWFFLFLVYI